MLSCSIGDPLVPADVMESQHSTSCRTNVAYILNNGKVFVSAFVKNADKPSRITISVAKDTTTTPEMLPNSAAAQSLVYQPRSAGLDRLALGLGTSIAAVSTATLLSAAITMTLNPLAPAGPSPSPSMRQAVTGCRDVCCTAGHAHDFVAGLEKEFKSMLKMACLPFSL